MAKASPFDFSKAISQRSDDPVASGELDIRDYSSWIINKALVHRMDCVEAVQLVNERPRLSKLAQYVVLRATITKRAPRRDEFWIKSVKSDELDFVKSHFGVGYERAQEILEVIGSEGVATIKEGLGGEEKKGKK